MVLMLCVSATALADPPITPPTDPSVVPVVGLSQPSAVTPQPALHALKTAELRSVKKRITAYGVLIRHWQSLMGLPGTYFSVSAMRTQSLPYARWILKTRQARSHKLHAKAKRWMIGRMNDLQEAIREWQSSMGAPSSARQLSSAGSIETRFNLLRRKARQVYIQYQNPPQKANFECIHGYEGSWTDEDSGDNGHYGGVQMGKAEWNKFGKPYAHTEYPYQASKLAQLWAAARYWMVSGFKPWPQTAHFCGLL